MLERLTLDMLVPLVGQPFWLLLDDGTPIETVLERATANPTSGWHPADTEPHRQSFTLTFLGPPQFVLPQRIYQVEHETLGKLEIFLVPIGRTQQGVSYEAVFS